MQFSRPALSALFARIRGDLLSRLNVEDVLRRSDTEVYARVLSGAFHSMYGYLVYLADQLFDDTAEKEFLERRAAVFGISRLPAAIATGSVTFTIQAGAVIPLGNVLQALDGVQYRTTADATPTGLTATAPIEALLAGAAGNRDAAAPLQLVSPIAGVNSTATAGEISGGADLESDDSLRARLLRRIQQPPHGGAAYDYIAWALEVPGTTRAWVYPQESGIGTVTVRFVRDNDGPGAAIIPDAGEIAAMVAYIGVRRPVTAEVFVPPPISTPLNFTISVTPSTAAVKDAISASLQDLLRREAEPNGTLLLSHIQEAVSIAAGEVDHVLTVPSANVVMTGGHISTFGTITWV